MCLMALALGQSSPWPLVLGNAASLNGWHIKALKPGVYGLSNDFLDTPWPKTLADSQRAASDLLPSTGIDASLEHGLSSAWVRLPERGFGTRCSS